MYVFYNEYSNNILQRLIRDYDKIPIVVNIHYNANISQNSRIKDSKYICKEIKLYYLECPSLANYEKQNAHTHTHIQSDEHSYTHTNIHTHIQACTQRHTHAHKHTRMHTSVRSRAPTHTKCSFVIGGQSLWNHLPYTVKEAGSIELFNHILKTVVFSQSFEIPAF